MAATRVNFNPPNGRAGTGPHLEQNSIGLNKAGVMLLDLPPPAWHKETSEARQPAPDKTDRLMAAMDSINRTYGHRAMRLRGDAVSNGWRMRAQRKSPAYTTNRKESPTVKPV